MFEDFPPLRLAEELVLAAGRGIGHGGRLVRDDERLEGCRCGGEARRLSTKGTSASKQQCMMQHKRES